MATLPRGSWETWARSFKREDGGRGNLKERERRRFERPTGGILGRTERKVAKKERKEVQ